MQYKIILYLEETQQNNNGKSLAVNYLYCYRSKFLLLSDFQPGFKGSDALLEENGVASSKWRVWPLFVQCNQVETFYTPHWTTLKSQMTDWGLGFLLWKQKSIHWQKCSCTNLCQNHAFFWANITPCYIQDTHTSSTVLGFNLNMPSCSFHG